MREVARSDPGKLVNALNRVNRRRIARLDSCWIESFRPQVIPGGQRQHGLQGRARIADEGAGAAAPGRVFLKERRPPRRQDGSQADTPDVRMAASSKAGVRYVKASGSSATRLRPATTAGAGLAPRSSAAVGLTPADGAPTSTQPPARHAAPAWVSSASNTAGYHGGSTMAAAQPSGAARTNRASAATRAARAAPMTLSSQATTKRRAAPLRAAASTTVGTPKSNTASPACVRS